MDSIGHFDEDGIWVAENKIAFKRHQTENKMIELIQIKLEQICASVRDEISRYTEAAGSQRKLSILLGKDENYINNYINKVSSKLPENQIKTLMSILKKIEKNAKLTEELKG